jgi:hypothetical protein
MAIRLGMKPSDFCTFSSIGLEASGAVATVNGAKRVSVVVLMLPMLLSFLSQRVVVAEQND